MATGTRIRFTARVQRKDPRLPVYVVVPGRDAARLGLTSTVVVEGIINGHPLGRRTIKAWGKGQDDWFVELPAPLCEAAQLTVGEAVQVELGLADTSLPGELLQAFSQDKSLEARWLALSERQRREASEFVRAARTQPTRDRRARSIAASLASATTDALAASDAADAPAAVSVAPVRTRR